MEIRFGTIEKVIVVELAILLALAITPALRASAMRQRSEHVATGIETVFNADRPEQLPSGSWPDDEPAGHAPAALAARLPRSVPFAGGDYTLDWDHWTLSEGTGRRAKLGELAAVGLTTRD